MIYEFFVEPFRNHQGIIKVEVGDFYHRRYHYSHHPFRSSFYEVRVPLPLTTNDEAKWYEGHTHIQRQHYDDIKNVSKVCHQMREEIGKAFWKNVYVDLNAWQFLIIDLLNDRPAVHEGLKGIQIGIDCDSDPSALNHLVDVCNCISEKLILDEFRLVFYTNPRVAREILDTGNDLKWVKAFRQIKVEKIKVELLLVAFEYESLAHPNAAADEDGDDGTHVTERIRRLAKKLGAEMEIFLRPGLPRVLADEDYYRETRTELLGEEAAAYG